MSYLSQRESSKFVENTDSSNELGNSDFTLKMNIAEFALHALLLFLII